MDKNISNKELHKIPFDLIRQNLQDTTYLSDDFFMTYISAKDNFTYERNIITQNFTVLILARGEAQMVIGTDNYNLKKNNIIFFKPGTIVNTLKNSPTAAAYMISFSPEFVKDIQVDLATSQPVYMRFGGNHILEATHKDVDEIKGLFMLIKKMIESDKEIYREHIIKTLFSAAFYMISEMNIRDNQHKMACSEGLRRSQVIFNRFMSLVHEHCASERGVNFYSAQLGITTKYLSSVVKKESGKTAARWIDESVIIKAKSMLMYSSHTIQEISTMLNFSTQSFFGKYFKQHTGVSPSRFKRK